jgi:hypothetical protein
LKKARAALAAAELADAAAACDVEAARALGVTTRAAFEESLTHSHAALAALLADCRLLEEALTTVGLQSDKI